MCGRFALNETPKKLAEHFHLSGEVDLTPSWNIAPSNKIHTITEKDSVRTLRLMKWGLIPSWADASKPSKLNNARGETVADKPSFSSAFKYHRCIIPASGFMVSRSFGSTVTRHEDLSESVAYFTTRAAEKLRHDGSVASSVCIYVRTNPFKENNPQYQRSLIVPLFQPTDDTMRLISAALAGLKEIYRSGYQYKKTGVMLMGLQAKESVQPTLFDDPIEQAKSDRLMHVMDAINHKMGKESVSIAASGIRQKWAMRRERKSPNYTTDWDELPVAG